MLPYVNRLTRKEDYEAVYRKGKPLFCEDIVFNILENGLSEVRIGVLVGVRFSKKAVDRNRIKRQIREIMQKNLVKMRSGMDIVISLKKTSQKDLSSEKIKIMLENALKKGKLIK